MTAYDPRVDSSPGTDELRADAPGADLDEDGQPIGIDGVILVVETGDARTCACGCLRRVAGKTIFRQGHDQRLMGILTRAHRNGQEVQLRQGGVMISGPAQGYGEQVLTDRGILKLRAALARPAVAVRTRKPADTATRGTVKIGRWTYAATRYGTGEVSYTKKDGTEHQADAKIAATFAAA